MGKFIIKKTLIKNSNKSCVFLVKLITEGITRISKVFGIKQIINITSKIINTFRLYKQSFVVIEKILTDFKPNAVILSEDVVGAVTPIVIKDFKKIEHSSHYYAIYNL